MFQSRRIQRQRGSSFFPANRGYQREVVAAASLGERQRTDGTGTDGNGVLDGGRRGREGKAEEGSILKD